MRQSIPSLLPTNTVNEENSSSSSSSSAATAAAQLPPTNFLLFKDDWNYIIRAYGTVKYEVFPSFVLHSSKIPLPQCSTQLHTILFSSGAADGLCSARKV
mmetsp:Transcript_1467/g.2330  ORF Transcript_1467/g.2330 Transcript_1467/m.2330 type:complete len:100 (+) Transcript_1467:425-724(+)